MLCLFLFFMSCSWDGYFYEEFSSILLSIYFHLALLEADPVFPFFRVPFSSFLNFSFLPSYLFPSFLTCNLKSWSNERD